MMMALDMPKLSDKAVKYAPTEFVAHASMASTRMITAVKSRLMRRKDISVIFFSLHPKCCDYGSMSGRGATVVF